jgi:hypothetical protein
MNAFFAGVVFGALLAGSVFTIFITSRRRPQPRREPIEWAPEFHDPQPPVTTRILIKERHLVL